MNSLLPQPGDIVIENRSPFRPVTTKKGAIVGRRVLVSRVGVCKAVTAKSIQVELNDLYAPSPDKAVVTESLLYWTVLNRKSMQSA